jgi:DNA-binding NarL/FixJ family response regulator
VIRIVVVDDHPAVRAGLAGLLRAEPGFVVLAAVGTAAEGFDEVSRWSPDVALIDYELQDEDGLHLVRRLGRLPYPPRVAIYTAFATEQLSLAAAVAGARAVVDKGEPVDTLLQVLRDLSKGRSRLEPVTPELLHTSAGELEPDDHPLLGLALAGEPPAQIADVLDRDESQVESRLDAIVDFLRPHPSPGTEHG